MNLLILYFEFLLICVVTMNGAIRSLENEVREKILRNYDRSALPSNHTMVKVGFTVLHFTMNEKLQTLDLDVWPSMDWYDHRLKYNKTEYPDISMTFTKEQIWVPDLVFGNSVSNDLESIMRVTRIVVDDGYAMWLPPSHVKARCIMDLTFWPYDVHNCSLNFHSWTYSSKHINISTYSNTAQISVSDANITRSEWEVIGNNLTRKVNVYPCCDEEYVEVVANIILKRIGKTYWWSKQMPVVVLGLFNVAIFLQSPSNRNRVVFGIIIFFANLYFLENLTQTIGHSSTHTPLMVRLISLQTLYTGIAIIATGIIFRLVKDPYCMSLSPRIEKAVDKLAKRLRLGNVQNMVEQSSLHKEIIKEDLEIHEGHEQDMLSNMNSSNAKTPERIQAHVVVVVVDRICLIVFTLLFLINIVAFSQVL